MLIKLFIKDLRESIFMQNIFHIKKYLLKEV